MNSLLAFAALLGLAAAARISCDCGHANLGRIVGGKETIANKYPWMASLHIYKRPYCGASIITPWHALTAAHCGTAPAHSMELIVGAHNITHYDDFLWIPVAKFMSHEQFRGSDPAANFDIAVVVTSDEIPFSKTVGPVCLPNRPLILDNHYVRLLGWGTVFNGGDSSEVLHEVDVHVMPIRFCQRDFPELQQKLCTFEARKDSCLGDSGSPLVWLDPETNRYTQAALSSYGECGGSRPSVNTDVSAYVDWINQQVQSTTPSAQVCRKI